MNICTHAHIHIYTYAYASVLQEILPYLFFFKALVANTILLFFVWLFEVCLTMEGKHHEGRDLGSTLGPLPSTNNSTLAITVKAFPWQVLFQHPITSEKRKSGFVYISNFLITFKLSFAFKNLKTKMSHEWIQWISEMCICAVKSKTPNFSLALLLSHFMCKSTSWKECQTQLDQQVFPELRLCEPHTSTTQKGQDACPQRNWEVDMFWKHFH